MTQNQLAYQRNQEEARSNRAQEEHKRYELEETKRSNRKNEKLKDKDIKVKALGNLFKGLKVTSDINDPSWYNKNPQLVKDAASFQFSSPIGSYPDIPTKVSRFNPLLGENVYVQKSAVPGVMTLNYAHTIPDAHTMKNIADKYYAEVRRANSGGRNYESNDLMMYLISVSEAFGQLTHAARIYSIANTYKSKNFYYSKGYLLSLGLSEEVVKKLIKDLANYRAVLNTLITRVNSLAIPNSFPLFARKVWLNGTIFKDHEVTRSSNYMFAPYALLKFNESDHSDLVPEDLDFSSIDNYLNQLEEMVNRLFYSEDIGLMSGDIQKAFGDSLVSMDQITEDFHIEEQYSPEVLSQINAAIVVGKLDKNYSHIYTKTNNVSSYILQGNPTDESSNNGLRTTEYIRPLSSSSSLLFGMDVEDTIVNMYKDDVTPDDVMVATRLQCNYKTICKTLPVVVGDNTLYRAITNVATEVVSTCTVVQTIVDRNGLPSYRVIANLHDGTFAGDTDIFENGTRVDLGQSNDVGMIYLSQILPRFDWAPRFRLLSSYEMGSSDDIPIAYDNMDTANYMVLASDRLKTINIVAQMSLYNLV